MGGARPHAEGGRVASLTPDLFCRPENGGTNQTIGFKWLERGNLNGAAVFRAAQQIRGVGLQPVLSLRVRTGAAYLADVRARLYPRA